MSWAIGVSGRCPGKPGKSSAKLGFERQKQKDDYVRGSEEDGFDLDGVLTRKSRLRQKSGSFLEGLFRLCDARVQR